MKCPLCIDSALEPRFHGSVEVDVCPTCKGVWLDRDELQKLVDLPDSAPPPPAPSRPRARDDRNDDERDRDDDRGRSKKKRSKSLGERLADVLDDVLDFD